MKFKVGDRAHGRWNRVDGTILEVGSLGNPEIVRIKFDNGIVTWNDADALELIAPKFVKGDIVTWGVGNLGYEYVGEVNACVVLRNPRGLGGFRSDSHYRPNLNAYVVPAADLDLRKVPPAMKTIKVEVEIRTESGKNVAYATSSEESGYGEKISSAIAAKTVEIEVPA